MPSKIKLPPEKNKKGMEKFEDMLVKGTRESQKIPSLREIKKLETASVRDLVDGIIKFAYLSRTSDVHIDPGESVMTVRYRIDGILYDVLVLPKKMLITTLTRIKVLSEMRTDEHMAAQDGRFRLMFDGLPVDVRVSIVPTYHGENVVMRLLVGQARAIEMEELGMEQVDLERVQRNLVKSYGMLLATGPTGSGKTTTLYSALQQLNKRDISIITIEDPIEYTIAGMTQIQVNPQTNLTFAQGLRSIVRQDPNVIMVGEIRDEETAGIAVNAAMTGHLLLSTLHTNDAAVTLPRLLDMGIEPFLIASTVNVAIGQRLVRKLCQKCVTTRKLSDVEQESLQHLLPQGFIRQFKDFAEPKGCDACNEAGYQGRIGVYEVLEMTERIRHMIMKRETADEIRKAAIEEGMNTMLMDGLRKASAGITSVAEVLRVIHS